MNKEILTTDNIPEEICWYNMQYNLDDKTILHYIEIVDWDEDAPNIFDLSVSFFGYHYIVSIYYSDILLGNNYCCAEGPSILFSSLEDCINNTHWELICKLINKMVDESYELENE